jgi:hypothetical protein
MMRIILAIAFAAVAGSCYAASITLELKEGAALHGPMTIRSEDGCQIAVSDRGDLVINRDCVSIIGPLRRTSDLER